MNETKLINDMNSSFTRSLERLGAICLEEKQNRERISFCIQALDKSLDSIRKVRYEIEKKLFINKGEK